MLFITETQADKVAFIECIILIICIILILDEFKPAMRAGWMAYIRKTYPDGSASGRNAVGQGQLVID